MTVIVAEKRVPEMTLPKEAPLPPSQMEIIKATQPVLKAHGEAITRVFYKTMLEDNPELRNIFNAAHQAAGLQQKALAGAVLAYATYIDDLPKLHGAVERIAHKHVSLHVLPEQYPTVGKYLLAAIKTVLGDAATPEIIDAWAAAYGILAEVFIGRERELYQTHPEWNGWRKFRIAKKIPESSSITSFYLEPSDGVKPLPRYLPGQYISLQLPVPGVALAQTQCRQYSLSEAAREVGDHYRISVKREVAVLSTAPGIISNLLHDKYQEDDEVEITAPYGDFFLDPEDKSKAAAPLVLISGGVGATPLMAILEGATRPGTAASARPISWIHGSHSSAVQPFAAAVREIRDGGRASIVATEVFLTTTTPEDTKDTHYNFPGHIDFAKLDADKELFLGDRTAEYYICGPAGFMDEAKARLEGLGVGGERIHMELFNVQT